MKSNHFKKILALTLATVLLVMAFPATVFAVNSTSKFSTPYKNSVYYTRLQKAKSASYSSNGLRLAAIAESQLGYLEGRVYGDLDGAHNKGKTFALKMSYKSGSKYKNYSGWLDLCEYNFWYYGCSDKSAVSSYASSTKKVSAATHPVSKYNRAWCAAFVSWCAAQAGLSSKMPATAAAGHVPDYAINKGGKIIDASERQPGDIVVYKCKKCNARSHVGIVSTDPNYSIEGNTDDRVKKVNLTKAVTNTCMSGHKTQRYYVRPNICDHKKTSYKVTKDPTCTTAGVRTYYCKACKAAVKKVSIAQRAHRYDSYHHCHVCGVAEPSKSASVTRGVYKVNKATVMHTTPYSKGKGGSSNDVVTTPKNGVMMVEYADKNADGQVWYYGTYVATNGKKYTGYVYSKRLTKKQTSFSFYEEGSKLFNVVPTGTVAIPRTSKENRTGYTLSHFVIYKDSSSTSRQWYTDQGKWATSSEIAKNNYSVKQYKPGSCYTFNAAWVDANNKYTTKYVLDAQWVKATDVTYTITYNANGGISAPGAQTKKQGTALTLSTATPVRNGYVFKGWATTASGSVAYAQGAAYTKDANLTLYAVWVKNPIAWNTQYVKNIKSTSALVGCTVTADCSKINRIGLQLKTANGSWKTVASWKVNSVLTYCTVQCGKNGSAASEISGNLAKKTTYSYRFYVETTNVGVQYSPTKTFTTAS